MDVFENEPLKSDNSLLELDNVTITPHTAGGSDKARLRSVELTCKTVAKYVRGEGVRSEEVVNKEVIIK
jgi:phosphoglycerate dehydrogenase-like enzyme